MHTLTIIWCSNGESNRELTIIDQLETTRYIDYVPERHLLPHLSGYTKPTENNQLYTTHIPSQWLSADWRALHPNENYSDAILVT